MLAFPCSRFHRDEDTAETRAMLVDEDTASVYGKNRFPVERPQGQFASSKDVHEAMSTLVSHLDEIGSKEVSGGDPSAVRMVQLLSHAIRSVAEVRVRKPAEPEQRLMQPYEPAGNYVERHFR